MFEGNISKSWVQSTIYLTRKYNHYSWVSCEGYPLRLSQKRFIKAIVCPWKQLHDLRKSDLSIRLPYEGENITKLKNNGSWVCGETGHKIRNQKNGEIASRMRCWVQESKYVIVICEVFLWGSNDTIWSNVRGVSWDHCLRGNGWVFQRLLN